MDHPYPIGTRVAVSVEVLGPRHPTRLVVPGRITRWAGAQVEHRDDDEFTYRVKLELPRDVVVVGSDIREVLPPAQPGPERGSD